MEKSSKREDALITDGWTRRFVADEPRLSEAVELYRSTRYEVHLEPLSRVDRNSWDGESGECRMCFQGSEDQYKILYTCPQKGKHKHDDV